MKYREIDLKEIPQGRGEARRIIQEFMRSSAKAIEITEHDFTSTNALRGAVYCTINRMGLMDSVKISIRDGRPFLIKL